MNNFDDSPQTMEEVLHPGIHRDPEFPQAPEGWDRGQAVALASDLGFDLEEDHWKVLKLLQEYYARHQQCPVNTRELSDALEESFHHKGGLRYLYELFPGGPLGQGCRLAGLNT